MFLNSDPVQYDFYIKKEYKIYLQDNFHDK